MKTNYYNMLNESFDKLLLEAQQVVIDFKNIFGDNTYDRFKAQKQRMSQPENDISYWVRRYNEDGEEVINELDEFISNFENKLTRSQKRAVAEEGAELIYEDDEWEVYHITTYEAAKKYGAHTRWCITGRYDGREDEGQYFFDRYLNNDYDGYYFFIRKGNDNEKYAVCPIQGETGRYDIWDTRDGRPGYVPNGPENVPGLPGVPVRKDDSYDYDLDNEEDDEDLDDFDGEQDEEPSEWEDENGCIWRGHRPPMPRDPVMMDIDDPDSFEFRAQNRDEVIKAFADKGFEGVEFVEEIPGTPVFIVKFMVEPEHQEFEMEDGEVYERDLPGERYTAFVFLPGQGGGPLLSGPHDGKLVASRTLEGAKAPFAREFQADNIRRNGEEPEEHREMQEESYDLKEGYYYYSYKVEESCKLKEENCKFYTIVVGEEPIKDEDGKPMHFKSELEANTFALQDLELLQGDYTIKCDNEEVVVG